jgi:tartrate dehydratase beta subunit/fumarate hydratase class I family protein
MITISRETGILMMMNPTSSDPKIKARVHRLHTPLSKEKVRNLRSGDILYLSGTIYGARDAAHKRMLEELRQGKYFMSGHPLRLRERSAAASGPLLLREWML